MESFVVISADKAVKPVSVMGMTKALQERIVLRGNLSRLNAGTKFSCVRCGNVLGSRGSVVPMFRRQLRLGQRLTLTDRRMTRFLLSPQEAVELLSLAAETSQGGEIFVRKSAAARLIDIASVLAAEAGRSLDYDEIGILPGERRHELLVAEEELPFTEDIGSYHEIHPAWGKVRPQGLGHEYGSLDHLIGLEEIRTLIAGADREQLEPDRLPDFLE